MSGEGFDTDARCVAVVCAFGNTREPDPGVLPMYGKSIVDALLDELSTVRCVDHWAIATVDPRCIALAERRGMGVLSLGAALRGNEPTFIAPHEWDARWSQTLHERYGTTGTVRVLLDARFALTRARTIEAMYDRLLEDVNAHLIYPVCEVEPHLYAQLPGGGEFYPVWEHVGLDRQDYPELVRRTPMWMHHIGRPRTKLPMRELWHKVPWYETLDCSRPDDLSFAEWMLFRQRNERGVSP
jgi:hypothetical protein